MADQDHQPPPDVNAVVEGDAGEEAAVAQAVVQAGVGDGVPQAPLQQQQQAVVGEQVDQQQAAPVDNAGGVPQQAAPVNVAGGAPQQVAQAEAAGGAPVVAQGVPAAAAGAGNAFGIDPAVLAQINANAAAEAVAANPQGDAAAIAAAAVGAAMAAAAAAAANAAGQAAPGVGQAAPGAAPGAEPGAVPGAAAGAGAAPGAAAGAGAGAGGQPQPNVGPGPAGPGVAGGPQAQAGPGAAGGPPPQAGAAHANPGMAGGPGQGGAYFTPEFLANMFRTFMATGVIGAVSRKKPEVKLPQFSSALPADWRDFRKLAENARVTNKWTDEEAKRVVFSQCVGEAGRRVRLVPIGGNPDEVPRPADAKTYDQYMDDIQIRFQPKGASALAYSEFISASQQPNEDYQAYHTRLEGLFCLSEPLADPQSSQALLRVFIQGLKDKGTATWLLDKKPDSYAHALELAQERQGHFAMVKNGNPRSAGGKTTTSFINAFGNDDTEEAEEYADVAVGAINYSTGAKAVSTRSANKNLRRFGPDYASKLQANDRMDGCENCGGNHPTKWCWKRHENNNNNNNNNNNRRSQSRPGAKSAQKQRGGRPNYYGKGKGRGGGQGSGRNVSAIEYGNSDDYSFDESVAALHGLKAAFRTAMNEGN